MEVEYIVLLPRIKLNSSTLFEYYEIFAREYGESKNSVIFLKMRVIARLLTEFLRKTGEFKHF